MEPIDSGESVVPPATPEPAAVTPTPTSLSDLSPEERLTWRKTGTLPDAPAASSTATADGQPAATAATSEADSDPATYKAKTKKRIDELLAENKRLTDLTRPKPVSVATAAPTPAPASTLVKPDPEKFTYGTADPDYLEALTDYKVESKLQADRTAAAAAHQKHESDAAIADINRHWTEKRTAAEARYPDFKEVALKDWAPGYEIPVGSMMDAWILQSEHGADVLYALQKTPADIRRILALSPHQQARELVKIEDRMLAAAAVKTVSEAPEPGPKLGVRAGDPASGSARALRSGDTGAYLREKTREEMAARKGR